MKAQDFIAFSKSIFLGILVTTMAILITSCTKQVSFLTSAVVPAAQGYVKVDRDKNKNYVIRLEISNLADVTRLSPPGKTYIVWMDAGQNSSKNIGQIDSSTRTLSSSLKASFEAISSINPTKIFISAENDASVQYPTGQIVMTTGNF